MSTDRQISEKGQVVDEVGFLRFSFLSSFPPCDATPYVPVFVVRPTRVYSGAAKNIRRFKSLEEPRGRNRPPRNLHYRFRKLRHPFFSFNRRLQGVSGESGHDVRTSVGGLTPGQGRVVWVSDRTGPDTYDYSVVRGKKGFSPEGTTGSFGT